jgi:LysM repeat protein
VQFAASRQRLKDLLKGLGTPHAAPEPSPAPAVAETPAVDAPATPPAPEPAPNVAETPAPTPAPEPAPAVAETPTPAPEPAPVVAETPAPEPAPAVAETPAPEPAPAVAETPTPREHTIAKGDSLNALAKRYGVTVENLRAWNSMNSDVVKIGQVLKIVAPEVAVPAEAAPVEAPAEPTPVEAPVTESVPAEPVTVAQPPDTDKREHTVASGETLGSIAGMYGVTVSDIRAWNGLDAGETVINAGAALVVYLPMAVPEEGSPTPEAPASAEKQTATKPAPGDYDTYEVAQGDNLRRIAQRFGTTQQKLMEMNDLKSADLVQIGWKLKVPRQAAAEITGSNP